uniref:Putative transcriptional regulator snip1 n=1 Tax=Anopheles marajoara TaxID=58244 RepID=A0A2M4BJK2_9DIPT
MSSYRRKHSRHSSGSEDQGDSSDDNDSVRERRERGSDRAEKRKSHKKHKKGKKERKERHARRSEDDASEESQGRRAAGRSDEDTNHWKSRLPAGSGDDYHRKGKASPAQRSRDESTRHRSPSGTRRRSRDGHHRSTRDQQQQQRHQQPPDSTAGSSRYGSDDRRGRPSARRPEYEPDEHGQRRATGRSDEDSDSANRSGYEARYKRQQHHHHHNREQSPGNDGRGVKRRQERDHPGRNDEIRTTDKASLSNLGPDRDGMQNNHRLHNQGKSRLAAGSGEGFHRSGSPTHRIHERSRSATRRRRSREGSGSGSEADQNRPRAIKMERQASCQRTGPPTIDHQPSTSRAATGGPRKRAPRGTAVKQEDDDSTRYEWGAKRAVKPEVGKDEPPNADDESAEVEKQKPNFALSGKLTEEANKVNGVVINYAEPPGACKPKRRWRLYPMKGDQIMPTLYIHRQSCYLIGRDRKVCDLPIDHPSCSKQHAVLQYRLVPHERPDGTTSRTVRPYIIDLDSSNGTFVNYKKIEPKRYLELFEKDVLMFGFSSREYVLLEENSKDDDGQGEG